MVKITFVSPDGKTETSADGEPGCGLLELGQSAGMPLEGTCEGQMACSTCHVVIDKAWFDKLPRAKDDEEDMLDLASGARRTSRLSCQIILSDDLDGMIVHIPAESRNMQGI